MSVLDFIGLAFTHRHGDCGDCVYFPHITKLAVQRVHFVALPFPPKVGNGLLLWQRAIKVGLLYTDCQTVRGKTTQQASWRQKQHSHDVWCLHQRAQYCTASGGPARTERRKTLTLHSWSVMKVQGSLARTDSQLSSPFESRALQVPGWEFSQRGALWVT